MDRKYFSRNELSLSANMQDIDLGQHGDSPLHSSTQPSALTGNFSSSVGDVFGMAMAATGRHSHVLSPTKETLMEHNLRLVGSAGGGGSTPGSEALKVRCLSPIGALQNAKA